MKLVELINEFKEKGIEFIEQQLLLLTSKKEEYDATLNNNKNVLLKILLENIQKMMKEQPGFPKDKIADIVNKSSFVSQEKNSKKGFDLLLLLIGKTIIKSISLQ